MSTNSKAEKSIGMRAKKLGRGAVAGVRRRPWVSGFVALAAIVLVSGVFLHARIQRMFARSAPPASPSCRRTRRPTDSPQQWRALGHAEFAKGHAMAALKAYDRALSLDHAAADEQMRTNLAAAYYGKAQPAAQELVVRHKLVDIDAAPRAADRRRRLPGPLGRDEHAREAGQDVEV